MPLLLVPPCLQQVPQHHSPDVINRVERHALPHIRAVTGVGQRVGCAQVHQRDVQTADCQTLTPRPAADGHALTDGMQGVAAVQHQLQSGH